jgi:predicted enzyme related to lactoylglutathione lyase
MPAMHAEPMLMVRDVKKSTAWYKQVLQAENDHDLDEFDRILSGGRVLLLLHHLDGEEHGAIGAPKGGTAGNGCLIWIYVDDLDAVYARARELKAKLIAEPHENPRTGWREFTLRDPDGYAIGIIEQ